MQQVEMGRGKSQLAIIDLGSSLSVTTPSVANSAGATLVRQSHTNPLVHSLQGFSSCTSS